VDAINNHPEQEEDEKAKVRPQVHLMRGPVGSGKTQDLIKACGEEQHRRLNDGRAGQVIGFTPRHDLNDEVKGRWEVATGLTAATIMGRTAKDPRHAKPGKEIDPNWCRNVPQVEMAQELGFPVKETCCGGRKDEAKDRCNDFLRCGYQQHLEGARDADLVLMPHALMVHQQNELPGKPHIAFIDEDFIDGMIFEMPREGNSFRFAVDDLLIDNELMSRRERGDYSWSKWEFRTNREQLHDCLQEQIDAGELGGVQKKYFVEAGSDGVKAPYIQCGEAKRLEYQLLPEIKEMKPNLKGSRLASCRRRNADEFNRRARHMFVIGFLDGLHDMMERDDVEVSGRIFLYADEKNGRICIGVRGLRPIVQQWRAKDIFVASATMPPIEIISHAFPECDIIPDDTDYDVAMSEHTKLEQVINAPVAKHRTEKERNRTALRRYAMERALECGMPATLIGAQKSVEEAFGKMEPMLPKSFAVRHFNAVAGLNEYEHVGLMISMGRAAPSPADVENQIAAITGRDPQHLLEGEWFKRAKGTIQRRDGGSVSVDCYMHPDPVVEAWRRHKHIAPVIQMIGRARPYNRTAETPLVLEVLVNEPLGIVVDEVLDWVKDELEPMALIEPMACDRFVALSPEVLCALWPKVFESERTAKRELEALRGNGKAAQRVRAILMGWRRFTFQKSGKGQKRREGYYDLGRFERVEDLRSALERVLGPGLQLKEG
jgi:hypothetical protein